MSPLGWIIRVLIVLFIVRLIVSVVRQMFVASPPPRSRVPPSGRERLGGRLVRDPECGTYVSEERAVRHGRGDAVQFFCSEACRAAWVARGERPASRE